MTTIKIGKWRFKEIGLDDIGAFADAIRETEAPTSRFSSNFAYLWPNSRKPEAKVVWRKVGGMLAVFAYSRKKRLSLICLPFGPGGVEQTVDVLLACMRYCYDWNGGDLKETNIDTVNRLQADYLAASPRFNRYFRLAKLEGREQFFSIPSLVSLPGKDFANIRGKINRFRRAYPDAVIRSYELGDYEPLLRLKKQWDATAGAKYAGIGDDIPYREVLRHHRELDHLVLVAEAGGKLAGMVSGGPLPNGLSWCYFLKSLPDYTGLSELLYVELAREINRLDPAVELFNVGNDSGVGLRAFKEKFRPVLSLERFTVYPRLGG